MTKKNVFAVMFIVSLLFAAGGDAMAQWSQATACPGWNNPANFGVSQGTEFYYSGQTGGVPNLSPNVMTGETGMSFETTVYMKTQLASKTFGSSGDCANLPNPSNAFAIMSSGTDANTQNLLPYVPSAQFNTYDSGMVNTTLTKSIRIGDACGGTHSTALYYNLHVTPQNAMFYIYYACVIEAPGHGTSCDPTFIIRVMRQNAANQWVQISDTLAYFVPSTPSTMTGGTVTIGQNGWHSSPYSYDDVYWKEWSKVALNLSNFVDENLRVEVMISDCCYSQHFAYAYICGECRPMSIQSSGCPPGLSTDVTTLTASRSMQNYVWYASEWGVAEPWTSVNPGQENAHFTWRQLTPDQSTSHQYNVQANDFRVTRRRNNFGLDELCDSMGNWQTFRCKMTSALDPAKPFDSYLYVNVQNKKPSMEVDSLFTCDGRAKLWNHSYVPGDPSLVQPGMTQWAFYDNPYCEGTPLATSVGDSASLQFEDTGLKGVLVRSFTTDPACYSDGIYPILPRENPRVGGMLIDPETRVLCDAAPATLRDTTTGENFWREWSFRAANAPDDDTSLTDVVTMHGNDDRQVTRSFTHGVEPIRLRVFNAQYSVNNMNLYDTTWCNTVVRDTISVFLHPELEVIGDTVVCEGSTTNATVRALGVDGCTYQWSLSPNSITGNLPEGPTLQVVPYADRATYYVRVTSPQGCVAWDSLHAYVVRPKIAMIPEDGRICPGDVATLSGSDADHFTWSASPEDPSLAGQEGDDHINVSPQVTTVYTMVGHGTNNCDATPLKKTVTIVPLPVPKVGLTPGFIDTDQPTVVLRDQSTYGVSSLWQFQDGSSATGREVSHVFENCIGFDSVPVTLTSYNVLDCPTVYPFQIPVNIFTAWYPTAFTPGSSDGNGKFSLHSINEYQFFHIYIYNRRGELVYESDDVHFEWDGTKNGEPCPQGAYVYTCRFRKPGTTTLSTIQGSVTLIR